MVHAKWFTVTAHTCRVYTVVYPLVDHYCILLTMDNAIPLKRSMINSSLLRVLSVRFCLRLGSKAVVMKVTILFGFLDDVELWAEDLFFEQRQDNFTTIDQQKSYVLCFLS